MSAVQSIARRRTKKTGKAGLRKKRKENKVHYSKDVEAYRANDRERARKRREKRANEEAAEE